MGKTIRLSVRFARRIVGNDTAKNIAHFILKVVFGLAISEFSLSISL